MSFYTAVLLLSCMTLCTMIIMVYENARFPRELKRVFYALYIVVLFVGLSEWGVIVLNNAPDWTIWIHKLLKCINYILTPGVLYFYVKLLSSKKIYQRLAIIVTAFNIILQSVSVFTGWTFYIDDNNVYQHGPYNFIYVIVYSISFVIIIAAFISYSKNYENANRLSMFNVFFIICVAIVIQEVINKDVKTIYLGLTFGFTLLFIHYNEFIQQKKDEVISKQKKLINTDVMTGLYSRYAFDAVINILNDKAKIKNDFVVVSIDVNGLKHVNDTMGHMAGDELICGAAKCIKHVFGKYGKCYRTGGDEFIALINVSGKKVTKLIKALQENAKKWHGNGVDKLFFAVGYAMSCEHKGSTIEELIAFSDEEMYKNKEDFYKCNSDYDRCKN